MIRTQSGHEVEILAVDESGGEDFVKVRRISDEAVMTCYRIDLTADGGDEEIEKAIVEAGS